MCMDTISIVKLIKVVKINRIMDMHLKNKHIHMVYISIYGIEVGYICKHMCFLEKWVIFVNIQRKLLMLATNKIRKTNECIKSFFIFKVRNVVKF